MIILMTSTVASIATEYPLATRVFARYGIDYCCGGTKPLKVVCDEKGYDVTKVIDEILQELSLVDKDEKRWDTEPLDKLIEHILENYHRPLYEELPRIEAMAAKVLEVHRDKNPEGLNELYNVFSGLKDELENHMAKEEQVLFPMILRGQGAMAHGPVSVMMDEHESAGTSLQRLRDLTNGYEVPIEACNTWRALWNGLEELEQSLHQHIHLENNILFPQALQS